MARRVLGWPIEKPATTFGGLTFGGGPIGNYMSHAVVSMVTKLRQHGTNGLLFANGGYATHNHTILLTRNPPPLSNQPPDFNVQSHADGARGPIPPLDKTYSGPAKIETCTVFYNRDGQPRSGVIIARLTDGALEPVGSMGEIRFGGDVSVWV